LGTRRSGPEPAGHGDGPPLELVGRTALAQRPGARAGSAGSKQRRAGPRAGTRTQVLLLDDPETLDAGLRNQMRTQIWALQQRRHHHGVVTHDQDEPAVPTSGSVMNEGRIVYACRAAVNLHLARAR